MILAAIVLFQIMDLRMAIVAGGNAVIRAGVHHLLKFQASVMPSLIGIPGLKKSAAAAATIVI